MTYHIWSSFFMFFTYRDKTRVLNVRQMIWDQRFYFAFYRDKYRVFNVQHTIYDLRSSSVSLRDKKYHVNVRYVIYDHRSSCFCLTEIKTVSLIFDRWSMIIVLCFVFYTDMNTVYRYEYRYEYNIMSVMFDVWSSFFMLVCVPEIYTMSLMFDLSSMIMVLNVWGFQR